MPITAISNPNLTRSEMPALTVTDAIGVQHQDNAFRRREWLEGFGQIDFLNDYKDSAIMRLLEVLPNSVVQTPKYEWIEASRLESMTRLAASVNSSATTLTVEDAGICNKGQILFVAGGEQMEVVSRDLTANTVEVIRGSLSTVATAHSAGDAIQATPQYMGETDEPLPGTGTMPGKPNYNFVTVFGVTWKSTRMGDNSVVEGEWGKIEKEQLIQMLTLRQMVGRSLYWSPRHYENLGSRGPRYVSGGLAHFIKDNVLALDNDPSKHTWANLAPFFDNLFRHEASSGQKIALVGRDLFHAHKAVATEMSRLGEPSSDAAKLGEADYVFETHYGPVRYTLADKDLPQRAGLGGTGFFIDPAHLRGGTFQDFGLMSVYPHIETTKQGLMQREDAAIGSVWLAPRHPGCHGIIQGAPRQLTVERSELL